MELVQKLVNHLNYIYVPVRSTDNLSTFDEHIMNGSEKCSVAFLAMSLKEATIFVTSIIM